MEELLLQCANLRLSLDQGEEHRDKLHRFRSRMVHEQYPGFLAEFNLANDNEQDNLESVSLVSSVWQENTLIGSARLILGGANVLLPVAVLAPQVVGKQDLSSIPSHRIAELSRVFVLPTHRGSASQVSLLKALLLQCRLFDISHIYYVLSVDLVDQYASFGVQLEVISEELEHLGERVVVTFSSVEAILKRLHEKHCTLHAYLMDTSSLTGGLDRPPMTLVEACARGTARGLKKPDSDENGRTGTLNGKGQMSGHIDSITMRFLNRCKGKEVLEIGSAYGLAMKNAVVVQKAKRYVATEMDLDHLLIAALELTDTILERKTTEEAPSVQRAGVIAGPTSPLPSWFLYQPVAELRVGKFPDDMADLPSNSFDSILAARVLHFCNPEELQNSLTEAHRVLKPGGRFYVLAVTPFNRVYEPFVKEYEQRVASDNPHPGYVTDLDNWLHPQAFERVQARGAGHDLNFVPLPYFHFLDVPYMHKICTAMDAWDIACCEYMPIKQDKSLWKLDGRERLSLICEKRASAAASSM